MKGFIVVLVTCSSLDEAEGIANILIEQKLAACVNVIPEIKSTFLWEKKLSKEKEVLLIAKTRGELFEPLAQQVKKLHSYDLPEIIALPIEAGSKDYLDWIKQATQK
jgi:periplasmic divalent cation tolerance protein